MHCERQLELRSHNSSYCLIEVVTKAGLTVLWLVPTCRYWQYLYILWLGLTAMLNCIIILFSSAMVFSSGLSCTSAITQMLQVGDHIVSMNDVYGGMSGKLILAIYH